MWEVIWRAIGSDLVAEIVTNLGAAGVARLKQCLREQLFWENILRKVVQALCTGYAQFEAAERAEGELLVVNEDFFQDGVVRNILTNQIVLGQTDCERLEERFMELYGNENIDTFRRNLEVALKVFQDELDAALEPAERAAFRKLQEQQRAISEGLKEGNQKLLVEHSRTHRMLADISDKIRSQVTGLPNQPTADVDIASEYKAQLDQIQTLLNAYQPDLAMDALKSLEERIWHRASSEDRYLLLAYKAYAHLQRGEEIDASTMFLDALAFQPERAGALANAALGYLLRGDRDQCGNMAAQAAKKDPTNARAHAMLICARATEELFDTLESEVPISRRNDVEVAMALGGVAMRQRLFAEAERWFRVAVENAPGNAPDPRGALADALLSQVTSASEVVPRPGMLIPHAELAREAAELYDNAWQRVEGTPLQPLRLNWLFNRSLAKQILNDLDGARQDLDLALQQAPSDMEIVKVRAQLAYWEKELAKAAKLLRQILETSDEPEIRFWLAAVLFEDGRVDEAAHLAQDLLDQQDLAPNARRDVFYLLTLYKLRLDDLEGARELADRARAEMPNDAGTVALCARVARLEGQTELASALLTEAQSKLKSDGSPAMRLRVADELCDSGLYEAAAAILEDIVDLQVDGEPLRRLLSCWYRFGQLGRALEICIKLREKYGPIEFITPMESAIYEEIDDPGSALRVCDEYIARFPDDELVRLRRAVASYRLKDFESVDEYLDQDVSITALSLHGHLQRVRLCAARDRVREALELAYEIRRHYFDSAEAHLAYVQISLKVGDDGLDLEEPQEASVDAAVKLEVVEDGTTMWIIIENRENASIRQNEFLPSHPLARAVIGKRVHEQVIHASDAFSEEFVVKKIMSKYIYARYESVNLYQRRFPETPGVWKGQIILPEGIARKGEGLQIAPDPLARRDEYRQRAECLYQEGKLAQELRGLVKSEIFCSKTAHMQAITPENPMFWPF